MWHTPRLRCVTPVCNAVQIPSHSQFCVGLYSLLMTKYNSSEKIREIWSADGTAEPHYNLYPKSPGR